MVAVVDSSVQQEDVVVDPKVYEDIADALVEKDLGKVIALIYELYDHKGPEHVYRALSLGGAITSRVRRQAKSIYKKGGDADAHRRAVVVLKTLVGVREYVPQAVVDMKPNVGYARL